MGTKFNVTIKPEDDFVGERADAAMLNTLRQMAALGKVPLSKITFQIECLDAAAEMVEDQIDAALSSRPMGIEVVVKTTRERRVGRKTMPAVTPMDAVWKPEANTEEVEEDGLDAFRRAFEQPEDDEEGEVEE